MESKQSMVDGAVLERKSLLFEQQEREGDKAYAAFKVYLEMGADRSLAKVKELMDRNGHPPLP